MEDIDLALRDAEVRNAQLYFLHRQVQALDQNSSANISSANDLSTKVESECTNIFREMISKLYLVLDQIYLFLYCQCQCEGNVSPSNAALKIKQPIKRSLRYSDDKTQDQQCKEMRNEWVKKQFKKIFGGFNFPESKRNDVRNFQNNLLQLQAIRKVDQSGHELLGPHGEPTLLRVESIEHNAEDVEHNAEDVEHNAEDIEQHNAQDVEHNAEDIQHDDTEGNLLQFNPSHLEVVKLKSTANKNDWNDTIVFNLLHFFKQNLAGDGSYLECKIEEGGMNLDGQWISFGKSVWISVPELSHLRQKERASLPTCHQYSLLTVCDFFLDFVKRQRYYVLQVLNHIEDYPYEVHRSDCDGLVTFKKKGQRQPLAQCRWEVAHQWQEVK